MKTSIYTRFARNSLILRDELAIDRTLLANERTLLAYLRSAVALLIAGLSIIHFAQHTWFWVIGLICLPFSVIISAIGIARYWRLHKTICIIRLDRCASADVSPNSPSAKSDLSDLFD